MKATNRSPLSVTCRRCLEPLVSNRMVIAVDLGGTHIRSAVVAEDGDLTHHHMIATRAAHGPLAVIERMADVIQT